MGPVFVTFFLSLVVQTSKSYLLFLEQELIILDDVLREECMSDLFSMTSHMP